MPAVRAVLRETGLGDSLFDRGSVLDVDFLGRSAKAEDFDFHSFLRGVALTKRLRKMQSQLFGNLLCHEFVCRVSLYLSRFRP
jgi:hypothetical protein